MRSFLFIITFLSVGCSSLPYKKTLMLTGAGVAAGTIYGLTKPEHQTQNATMYGALGGLSAAVAGLVLDIDEADGLKQKAENERLLERNRVMDAEVMELKKGMETVEERARYELGMVKEGETLYLLAE